MELKNRLAHLLRQISDGWDLQSAAKVVGIGHDQAKEDLRWLSNHVFSWNLKPDEVIDEEDEAIFHH
jgi:hypothetical protein